MTNTENTNFWKADEGCFLVRKADNFIMGEDLYLGEADDINNYEDREYTEESYVKFYHDLGLKTPQEREAEEHEKHDVAHIADSSLAE